MGISLRGEIAYWDVRIRALLMVSYTELLRATSRSTGCDEKAPSKATVFEV